MPCLIILMLLLSSVPALSVQQKLNGQLPVSQGIPFVLYQKGSFRSAWVVAEEQGKRIGNYVFNYSFSMKLIDFKFNRKIDAKG